MSTIKFEYCLPSGQIIRLVHGDITEEHVDAIVNAANSNLQHGGGVAAAIVRKGGAVIQKESDKIGYVPVGQVALTTAGKLPAKKVIHAVGPRWGEGDEDNKLRSAVWNSLLKAHEEGFKSIAMPAISSGIFGFPKDSCAKVLIQTTLDFCTQYANSSLREIRFTLIDEPTVAIFLGEFKQRFGSPREVTIVDYNPIWPTLYEEEKARILNAIGHKVVAIEHVGSTAVPGLGGKPIIDIMVAVRRLADVEECTEPLRSINYEYLGERGVPGRRFFRKPPGEDRSARTHHLHMVEQGSDLWEEHLLFRDYLRAHPNVAQKYYELKKALAAKCGSDRSAYAEAKASFIEAVITEAKSWKEARASLRSERR